MAQFLRIFIGNCNVERYFMVFPCSSRHVGTVWLPISTSFLIPTWSLFSRHLVLSIPYIWYSVVKVMNRASPSRPWHGDYDCFLPVFNAARCLPLRAGIEWGTGFEQSPFRREALLPPCSHASLDDALSNPTWNYWRRTIFVTFWGASWMSSVDQFMDSFVLLVNTRNIVSWRYPTQQVQSTRLRFACIR